MLELQLQQHPPKEYLGLISFRIDWFDLVVQGTLKSLLQYHNWKASIHHYYHHPFSNKLTFF